MWSAVRQRMFQISRNTIHFAAPDLQGPTRPTEMCTLTLKNDPAGSRNIFVSLERLLIESSYHKREETFGGIGKPIARFPDAGTVGY